MKRVQFKADQPQQKLSQRQFILLNLLEQPDLLVAKNNNYFKIVNGEGSDSLLEETKYLKIKASKVRYGGEEAWVVSFSQIDDIIKNQLSAVRVHYQDALTATISHEQMNPLNSIVNIMDMSIQHIIEILDLTEEESYEILFNLEYRPKFSKQD